MSSRDYHFVITLQFQGDGEHGPSANTAEGTLMAGPKDTRQTLYQRAYKSACESLGAKEAITLFSMLEPNDL